MTASLITSIASTASPEYTQRSTIVYAGVRPIGNARMCKRTMESCTLTGVHGAWETVMGSSSGGYGSTGKYAPESRIRRGRRSRFPCQAYGPDRARATALHRQSRTRWRRISYGNGKIDILAVDLMECLALVELKVSKGPDSVERQLVRYRGWLKKHRA